MSYRISPWRAMLHCDWPGCTQCLVGEEYEPVRDLRQRATNDAPLCRPWFCGRAVPRPGDRLQAIDLCPEHARERAALFALVREQRARAQAERADERAADAAARRRARALKSSS